MALVGAEAGAVVPIPAASDNPAGLTGHWSCCVICMEQPLPEGKSLPHTQYRLDQQVETVWEVPGLHHQVKE